MTHVVLDSCISCKYTDCIEVCPVDCFHEGANFLVINPDECIDCGLCINECPVKAIKQESDLLPDELPFVQINADFSLKWPVLNYKKSALDTAPEMATVKNKLNLIIS